LGQGEYVAIGPLEATYLGHSALIRQIYIYGSSYRSFLLAVVVPHTDIACARLGHEASIDELRTMVLAEMQKAARTASLKSFEVPRDVLIELEPFTHENGLLSSVRKPLRPKLKERYQDALEEMYRQMDRQQQDELALLRRNMQGLSTLDRVAGALKANLGLAVVDPENPQSYSDLGGDSLGAVSLSLLFEELFGVTVPVSIILNPAGNCGRLARYIDQVRTAGVGHVVPSFASVHGTDAVKVQASDFTLDAFLDAETLITASDADPPAAKTRTVLLTGATGFLGRFLCMEWMEALSESNGKVICIVRGSDNDSARKRLDEAIGTRDPALTERFRLLADKHLEVVAGDLVAQKLGLDDATFARFAEEVDQIVHPGALVNHLLAYKHLFEPNVVGTAELIRFALCSRQKRFDFVSTFGVPQMNPGLAQAPEDTDVRVGAPEMMLRDSYACGYGASKWASEVLLREANEQLGLPVTIYRPDMIMAHSRFKGQINVPDMFTRLLFSLVVTGIAPETFYERQADGGRARAHYDGMPVDFLAAAMQQLGAQSYGGFRTFNTISAHHDDGVSLDAITDWIGLAGYPIKRIRDHTDWVRRFADKLRNLPDEQRQHSSLSILSHFDHPHPAKPLRIRNDAFVAAVRTLPAGPDVPHLSAQFIRKYLDDMRLVGLLPDTVH
jgi:fatty acid CoA ligase FadD9